MDDLVPLQLPTLAAALSLLIIPVMWRLAPRLGLVDLPDPRKVHKAPVPRVGGWGITIGSVIPLLIWVKLDAVLQSLVLGMLILFLFGIWDDLKDIGHWTKFIGQLLAAAIVVYYGDLYVSRIPFFDGDGLNAAVGKPLTIFALIGVINAINHSDGLDGLAAGESVLTLIGLGILGYLTRSAVVVSIVLTTLGGILGFLRYNSYPARVFMGDAGSQVLGFILGFMVIYLTQIDNTAISAAVPLLLLGVPIADILAVLYQRIRSGNNWFKASRNHIHHRLLDLGFAHYQTVIIIYSVHATLIFGAVALCYAPDLSVTITYVIVIAALFAALMAAERSRWSPGQRDTGPEFGDTLSRRGVVGQALVRDSPWRMIAVAAPTFMLLGSVWVARVPRDIALMAAGLAVVLAGLQAFRVELRSMLLVRLTIYITAIACAYLVVSFPGLAAQRPIEITTSAIVVILVAALGIYLRYGSERKFGTTPTDYLILLALLALLMFAAVDSASRSQIEIVVYAVVLLYSCEVLIGRGTRRGWNPLNAVTLATLTILAVRGAIL